MADCVSRSTSSCASSVRWLYLRSTVRVATSCVAISRPGAGPAMAGGCQAVVGHVPDQVVHSFRLRGWQLVAGHRQAHRPGQAEALRQEPGAAGVRDQAILLKAWMKLGAGRRDRDVAGHHAGEAPWRRGRDTVDGEAIVGMRTSRASGTGDRWVGTDRPARAPVWSRSALALNRSAPV